MRPGQQKILVVDDDVQIRRALRNALSARGYEVVLAAGKEEALEAAAVELPRMVILDLGLPDGSGIDVCKELRTWSKMPILVLSVYDRPQDKVAALDMGADDYLTKPFDTSELLARIRSHLRRADNAPAAEPIYEFDGLRVDLSRRQVTRDGEPVHLTRTEFALLQYLVQNAERVVTYSLLLEHVWGNTGSGDTQTLRVHVGNLRRKVERVPEQPRHIITEAGVGYRFVP
jgi:two-component system KDP operon response regulator KdpE